MSSSNKSSRARPLASRRVTLEALRPESSVRELHDHWCGLRPAEGLPRWGDFDPVKLPRQLLPWVFLLDVLREHGRLDYYFRLAGTANATLVGRDATGKRARALFGPEAYPIVSEAFDATVAEARPTFWSSDIPHVRLGSIRVERGIFPLSEDGRRVDRLIGIAVQA